MKKDTYYFTHDYNTRNDQKIKKLISKHGYLGYGLFWALIEELYNNANALHLDYDTIAFDLRVDSETIKSIINDYDLFAIKDGFFGSVSVEKRLNDRLAKSTKARESALSRWSKSESNANALPSDSDSNAIKEKKVKRKRKEKEIIIPPFEEFFEYCKSKYIEEGKNPENFKTGWKRKYDSWVENNWRDGFDNEIKNWKTKILNSIERIKAEEPEKPKYYEMPL